MVVFRWLAFTVEELQQEKMKKERLEDQQAMSRFRGLF